MARWSGGDLTRINGLAVTSVLTILSEIGPDLHRFNSVKHFCSCLGPCPGTKVSGDKVLSARTRRSTNWLRQAPKLAAMSLSRNEIPVYEALEQHGLTVWLVDARQLKYVPGSKSDVQDCQWLQKLMRRGLLRAVWRPGDEVCVVRALLRQREVLLTEQAIECSARGRRWCR